jgi:SAM-dependent methyltransferase
LDSVQYTLSPDVIIWRRAKALFLSNPRTRTHVEIEQPALASILALADGSDERGWAAALQSADGWDRTIFNVERGLWADQTGLGDERREPSVQGGALFDLLHRRWMIHQADRSDYDAYLTPLTSVLDRKHLGTFHERVGQFLALDLRLKDKWRWWHDQKFHADGLTLNDGPYKVVQERFFDAYYGAKSMAGLNVLDFACGNGFFSNKFSSMGATVIGVDTSAELIDLAKRNFGDKATFHAPESDQESLRILHSIASGSIDLIYMSDVMLILVEEARHGTSGDTLRDLLAAFRRLLSPRGRIEMMEPNSQYWLGGFYGDPALPYAIVPEYRQRTFNVAPTIDEYVGTMSESGFALAQLMHPGIDSAKPEDREIAGRPPQFPLWDFMSFVPLAS